MKFTNINRKFNVGLKNNIKIKHIANIYLSSNQQVTFVTNKNCEFDLMNARKVRTTLEQQRQLALLEESQANTAAQTG